MAKKTASKEEPKNEALEKVNPASMVAPDFVEQSTAGTENIGHDDIQMPRLALAQKMSPEVDKLQEKFIEDLEPGQFFNNVSQRIYGEGPIRFIVIRADRPRGIEFKPLDQGGGIVDFNVPLNDPRMQWGADGSKPVATKFYDFIIMLFEPEQEFHGEMIALSLKSTGIKVAKRLNTLIKQRVKNGRPAPIYSGLYSLKAGVGQSKQGPYSTYEITNAGFIPDEETYNTAKAFHQTIADKNIIIDREPGADDDDFPGDDTKGM